MLIRQDLYTGQIPTTKVVFKDGIKSWGKNDDLLDQMKGVSTQYGQKHNGLLVSTSAMEAGAIKWAETQMKNSQAKKSIYVYKIRADANYFIVFESLMNAFGQTEDKEYEDRAKVAKFYDEWDACGGVKAQEIEMATEYQRDPTNNPQSSYLRAVGAPVRNQGYGLKTTKGSQHPYVPSALRVRQ